MQDTLTTHDKILEYFPSQGTVQIPNQFPQEVIKSLQRKGIIIYTGTQQHRKYQ